MPKASKSKGKASKAKASAKKATSGGMGQHKMAGGMMSDASMQKMMGKK